MPQLMMDLPAFATDYSAAISIVTRMDLTAALYGPVPCMDNHIYFDDPDWISSPGQAFSAPIGAHEILHGDESGIINRIEHTVDEMESEAAAIIGTTVSALLGSDLKALASKAEARTGIPCIAVDTDGFGFYRDGIRKTLISLIDRFGGTERKGSDRTVNVLGCTHYDLPCPEDMDTLRDILHRQGFDRINFFPGAYLEDYPSIGSADLNLAVSSSGLDVAIQLNKRFGTDYSAELPVSLEGIDVAPNSDVLIVGDRILSASISSFLESTLGCNCRIASFFEPGPDGTADQCVILKDEFDLEKLVFDGGYDAVIGDPLLKSLMPVETGFVSLPHPAISGNLFKNECAPLFDSKVDLFQDD